MIHILWSAVLVILYLFFMIMTPVKAPSPDKIVKKVEKKEKVVEAKPTATATIEPVDPATLIAKGQEVYTKNCLTCHNKDPNVKGAIGPELVDAPLEVMQVKVKTGRYPEVLPAGFVPKRTTKQMRKFPNLEVDVPAIHAYIQSLKKK